MGPAAAVHDVRPRRRCDDSPGKHASAHYAEMHHPIVRSFQSPDDWGWCYVDKQYLDADRL